MRNYMFRLVREAGKSTRTFNVIPQRFCAADMLQKSWGTDLLSDISLFGNRMCLIYNKVTVEYRYYGTCTASRRHFEWGYESGRG